MLELVGLDHIVLRTARLAPMLNFYCGVLGCVIERETSLDLGLTQLRAGAALIDACPDTRFILDHCGVPAIASGDLAFWREQLREISRRPNLACKISGIIAYAAGEITADTLRPVVEHAIDCFGWDRVVWGSDWPVCNLTRDLASWTRLLDEILSDCSEDELAALYHRNARSIYRLSIGRHNKNHTAS